MSTLAETMVGLGYKVSGSDASKSETLIRLGIAGIKVTVGHSPGHLAGAGAVIYSSAVSENNVELLEAKKCKLPCVKRSVLLGELMKRKFSIGVSGTHGKTSTTIMLADIWAAARIPTIVIGGGVDKKVPLPPKKAVALSGNEHYLIAEADEYDRSFLNMYPSAALVTNIDREHLDCYRGLAGIKKAFLEYLSRLPFHGLAVINVDDENTKSLVSKCPVRAVTYGTHPMAQYSAHDLKNGPKGISFKACCKGKNLGEIKLRVWGEHNATNALGALALARELGVPMKYIKKGLWGFEGARRRMDFLGRKKGVSFFDDYAHHPTEVNTTLKALRLAAARQMIVVFQPHLFSRTKSFYHEFAQALSIADTVFVAPVYGARERPVKGVNSGLIINEMKKQGFSQCSLLKAGIEGENQVYDILKQGDLLVTMGAGDINAFGQSLFDKSGNV